MFCRRRVLLLGIVGTPKLQSNDGINDNVMKVELKMHTARRLMNNYKLTKPAGKYRHRLIENDYSSGKRTTYVRDVWYAAPGVTVFLRFPRK